MSYKLRTRAEYEAFRDRMYALESSLGGFAKGVYLMDENVDRENAFDAGYSEQADEAAFWDFMWSAGNMAVGQRMEESKINPADHEALFDIQGA